MGGRHFFHRSKKSMLKGFRRVTPTALSSQKREYDADASERTCSSQLKDDPSVSEVSLSETSSNRRRMTPQCVSCSFARERNVRFLDEEGGFLITEVNYRPRTAGGDKRALYYTARDLDRFEKEHLYEQLGEEIRGLQEGLGVDENRISNLVEGWRGTVGASAVNIQVIALVKF